MVGARTATCLPSADRDEGRAQRDFGLAEADVAADQAVHRLARAHVVDDGVDRRRLVGRFLEAEALGERVQVVRLDFELMALARGAPGVEVEQLGGGVADLLRRLLLGAVPVAAAELVQRRLFGRHAAVAADQVQLRHRHVELVVPGIFQVQKFRLAFAQVEIGEAEIAADTVLGVHYGVADAQLRQVAHHALDRGRAYLGALAGAHRAGVELGFGDDADILVEQGEAVEQRRRAEHAARSGGEKIGEVRADFRRDAIFGQVLAHGLAPARRFGEQQHARGGAREEGFQPRERIGGAALDRERRQRGRDHPAVGCGAVFLRRADVDAREILRCDEKFLGRQEHAHRRQQRLRAISAQQLIARLGFFPERVYARRDVAVQAQRGLRRQVIENGGGVLEEQRQKVFDSTRRDAVTHVLVDVAPGRIAFEGLAKARAKPGSARFVERKLARGQQAHFLHFVNRALRIDVEGAYGFDFLVEQVDAVGQGAAHGEQVDEPAAHAIFARGDYLGDVTVAGQRQLRAQLRQAEFFVLLEKEGVGGEIGRRREAVQRGARRNQREVAAAARDRI